MKTLEPFALATACLVASGCATSATSGTPAAKAPAPVARPAAPVCFLSPADHAMTCVDERPRAAEPALAPDDAATPYPAWRLGPQETVKLSSRGLPVTYAVPLGTYVAPAAEPFTRREPEWP